MSHQDLMNSLDALALDITRVLDERNALLEAAETYLRECDAKIPYKNDLRAAVEKARGEL